MGTTFDGTVTKAASGKMARPIIVRNSFLMAAPSLVDARSIAPMSARERGPLDGRGGSVRAAKPTVFLCPLRVDRRKRGISGCVRELALGMAGAAERAKL